MGGSGQVISFLLFVSVFRQTAGNLIRLAKFCGTAAESSRLSTAVWVKRGGREGGRVGVSKGISGPLKQTFHQQNKVNKKQN